ncbi:hypothetical protein MB84_04080 [Pandoraea oxalativorans]|uniref:Uncharacterized protein n=1 Tax=Pandoraea oxalativorans TaxID=573737 RepID=A0A0E3YBH5_9BURK|nr:hypothetical protein MB84_04080 [Pandoraea oxalativorans]
MTMLYRLMLVTTCVTIIIMAWKLNQPTLWDGAFPTRRALITTDIHSGAMVRESLPGRVLFRLTKGDDCLFLSGSDWERHDAKDPYMVFVPVFCVGKGAGWTLIHDLLENEVPLKSGNSAGADRE